jgi:hypothetical protein
MIRARASRPAILPALWERDPRIAKPRLESGLCISAQRPRELGVATATIPSHSAPIFASPILATGALRTARRCATLNAEITNPPRKAGLISGEKPTKLSGCNPEISPSRREKQACHHATGEVRLHRAASERVSCNPMEAPIA